MGRALPTIILAFAVLVRQPPQVEHPSTTLQAAGACIASIGRSFLQAVGAMYSMQGGRQTSAYSQAADSLPQKASTGPSGAAGAEADSVSESADNIAFPRLYGYEIVRELPHQADAFTQGLEYDRRCAKTAKGDGFRCTDIFWESTGEVLGPLQPL